MKGIHREISSTIADAIIYWQLEMKRREAGDDPRAIFNKAKAELRDLLKVDATVHPELNGAGQEAADKALKAMAEECGIAPDEALIDDDDGHDDEQDDQGGESDKPKQADILVSLAKQAKLFHTPAPDWEEYADIIVGGRRETHRIRGKSFRQWLRHQYFLKTKSGCSNEALQVAVETIAAFARFEGEKHEAHCRIAELAGAIYIDLGDETWRAIEVTKSGWKVVDEPPVRFRRSASTKPLPIPQTGSGIKLLRPFCNVKGEDEFALIVAYTLAALRPNSNYPVLGITGEHGTAKSTLVNTLARFIDPRMPAQRSLPRCEDDLIVAAKGAHLLAYDNVSGLPDWLSDAICRLATGGGAGKRRLYSDDDEILFAGRRPVILNGIEDIVTRADLVDRAVLLMLEPIAETKRREEKEIAADLEAKAPRIFGVLLDGLVAGLGNMPRVHIQDKPRMADFALWAEACTRAYWPAGTFLKAYRAAIAGSVELVIENNPVGAAVRAFMAGRSEWSGSATGLLKELSALIGEPANKERSWPKVANALSGKLRRAAPPLRKVGIHIAFDREGHGGPKVITIQARRQPEEEGKRSTPPTPLSPNGKEPSKINGAGDAGGVDPVSMGDDPVSMVTREFDTTKSLENNAGGDGGDGDDVLHPSSNGYAISHSPEDRREPGELTCRVRIREVRHPAIKSGPDDDLEDFAAF